MTRGAVIVLACIASLGCTRRPRARRADPDTGVIARSPGHTPEIAPTRATESSQPRWYALTHGPRPEGRERWRHDLTPKQGWSEPVTDGETVYVGAARVDDDGPSEAEVFAFDLNDGTLRWHVPVEGLDERPLLLAQGVVIAPVSAFCRRRAEELPGGGPRRCVETGAPAVVGLDAATGRERFRVETRDAPTQSSVGSLIGSRLWVADGPSAMRALVLPAGTAGPRAVVTGTLGARSAVGPEMLLTLSGRGGSRLALRVPTSNVARWQKPVPGAGPCPPVVTSPVAVLPAFTGSSLAGAPRAFMLSSGADLWTVPAPPARVDSCGAIENGVFWQVLDGAAQGFALADGRRRGRFAVPSALSGPLFSVLDGVAYVSVLGRLVGMDLIDGHAAVTLPTGAHRQSGLVLHAGSGVVVTRDPGLVIGFD